MKKQSTRRGATIERSVVLAKITRMKKDYRYTFPAEEILTELADWLKERVPRFKAKKGGL